jgi:hypothetical protein
MNANQKCADCGHPYKMHSSEDTDVRNGGGECLGPGERGCGCPEFTTNADEGHEKKKKMKAKKIKKPAPDTPCALCSHPYNAHGEGTDGQCFSDEDEECGCPEFSLPKKDHFKRVKKDKTRAQLSLAAVNVKWWKDKALEAAGVDTGKTDTFIGRFDEKKGGLPKGSRVSFRIGKGNRENIIDVYVEDGVLWVHHAIGNDDLFLRGHSSNLFQFHMLKGRV